MDLILNNIYFKAINSILAKVYLYSVFYFTNCKSTYFNLYYSYLIPFI